ncbi:MAG TPA: Rrf2 family transcriptional regulator [Bacteroidota bacterium]|nr:Rrf2 family transcriptional regulator [Bacteroidota bacterium]
MFQLSKKVEYALIALRHMASGGSGRIYTTKEISDRNFLSYELLAKVMQKLARKGFIASYQGVHGGYILAHDAGKIKIAEVIRAIEEKRSVTIIQCEASGPDDCSISHSCTIKNPLVKLQSNINRVFEELTLMEMF